MEKWEIDLRTILQDLNKNNSENQKDQPTKIETKKNHSNLLVPLVLLGILCFFTVLLFTDKSQNQAVFNHMFAFVNKKHDEIQSLRVRVDEIDKKVVEMDKMVLETHDKVRLIGSVVNENFTIIKNKSNNSSLVFFNRDWSLDKMPQFIRMTEEDKEYLSNHVKKDQ